MSIANQKRCFFWPYWGWEGCSPPSKACWCYGVRADLAEVAVAVDVLLLVTVLQLVVLDVEPERLHDAGTGLGVHPQQASQARVQFVLWWLQGHTK